MIAGAFSAEKLHRSENMRVNLAAYLPGCAAKELRHLAQADVSDDQQIDIAVCLFACLGD